MCAIVGSFDKDKLGELIELNSYRGNHSYSFLEFDYKNNQITKLTRGFGEFDFSIIDNIDRINDRYYIAHTQAPTTTGKGFFNIHPSEWNDTLLWHNGILKEDYIKELQEDFGHKIQWDTRLLHYLLDNGDELDGVNGTFSCVYWDGEKFLIFRNEISPLFSDDDWNISSTKFEGSKPTISGRVMKLDFNNHIVETIEEFTTRENPYYFGE